MSSMNPAEDSSQNADQPAGPAILLGIVLSPLLLLAAVVVWLVLA